MPKHCGTCGRWLQKGQEKRPVSIRKVTSGTCGLNGKEYKVGDMEGCFCWERMEPKELERRKQLGII